MAAKNQFDLEKWKNTSLPSVSQGNSRGISQGQKSSFDLQAWKNEPPAGAAAPVASYNTEPRRSYAEIERERREAYTAKTNVETPRDKYDEYLAQARTAYTSPRAIREQTGPLTVEERNAAVAESRAATRAAREKGEEGLRSLGLSESQIKGSARAMTRPAQERAWHYAQENNPNLMTAEELKQYISDYETAEAERQRLLTMDLDAVDEQIKEAKAAAKASHVRNTNRAGRSAGRDSTKTDADRQLAALREDRNKAAAAQKNAKMEQTVADNQAFYDLVDSRMQNAPKQASEQIPYDRETQRILQEAGYSLADQKELLEARRWVKEIKRYDEAYQHAVEMATYHPFTASVVSVPANLAGGVTGMVGLVGQKIEGRDIMNVKGPGMGGYAYTQGARNTVSQNLDAATGGKLASFLYQTGMSMADSAAIMAMAGMGIPAEVGTALLGASAATDATVQAKLNGADDARALATGLAAGAAEYIFEKWSIDRFLKLDRIAAGQQMKQILKTELKNIGKQALTEGSEEVFTDLANFITDAIINGGGSEYNRAVRAYMAQGMSEKAARNRATNDFIAQLALSGAGGALSGGVFGSVGGVVNIGRTAEVNAAVRDIYGADTAALVEEALALDPTNETALAAQERLNEGKTVSADMQRAIVEQNQEIIERQTAQEAEAGEQLVGNADTLTEAAQAAEMEEINGESGSESAERYDRLAGREAVAGMAQAAREKARQQAAAADSIRTAVEAARIGETKTVNLGISSAVAGSTVRVVPDNLYTDEMRTVAAENAGNGVETVFVVGPIRLQDGGMARGWISDDGKKIVIRADHAEFTVSQLARHENFHALVKQDSGLVNRVAERITERYGDDSLAEMMLAYADAYNGAGMTADEILEEICADAYAGMNAIGQEIGNSGDASRFRDIAEAGAEEARGVESESEGESESGGSFSRDINQDRAEENVKTAEAYFGTTYRISEAGYLLTDGKMLDFSGRHEGGPGGYRTVDHRDIKDALGDDYGGDGYSDGLIQFMREGNVRLMPEDGGINMIVKPNPKQMQTLDRYISHFRGEVILDFDDEKGNTVNSVEYSRGTYSKSILWAIEDYFDKGILPEKNGGGSFSRDTDAEYITYGPNAVWTEKTLDNHIHDYAYGKNKSKGYAVRMRLDDFLKLTTNNEENTERRANIERQARESAEYGGKLNVEKLSENENRETGLHLSVNLDTWRVEGHEGRHRAVLMMDAGVETAPIIISNYEHRYDEKTILPSMKLWGQRLDLSKTGQGPARNRNSVTVEQLIPLSEDFRQELTEAFSTPENNYSLRYSIDPVESLQKENERLREDLDKLAERKAYFKAQGQQTYETVSPAIIRNMAADYVKNTTLDAEDITADLQALGDFMHGTHKGMSSSERYAQAKAMAADIGRELVSHYAEVINPEDAAEQKRLRKELREHPMSVSREVKNDFDNWSEWRKANPGIAIKTDATPVDVRYSELREMFGETYFPSNIVNPADQLRQIARAVEMMGPRTENTKSYYAEAATEEMANQILRDLIHPTQTDRLILADQMYYKRKTAEAVREQRDIRERERQRGRERVDRLVQKQRETTARRKEREKVRKFRPKIEKLHKELRKTLLHPTDSKYIPEQFRLAALDVLRIIDLSGEKEGTKAKAKIAADLLKINDLYNDLKNEKGLGKDANLFYEYDEDTANNIAALRQHLENTPVRELTADETEDVYTILHDIMVTFREARWQIGKEERKLNAQVGSAIAKEQIARKANMTPAQKKTAAYMRLSVSPLRNVAYMASYNEESELYRLFDDLNRGLRRKNEIIMGAEKLFERFQGKRLDESANKEKEYTIGCQKIRMTEQEAIAIVLSYEREMANGDTNHLQGGGVVITDKELEKKRKGEDAISQGQHTGSITKEDIDGLSATFDDWAKDCMDVIRYILNDYSQPIMNEATLLTKHRAIATVKKYFPFMVDQGTIEKEIEGVKFDASLENAGMLKSVQKGASNPLIIRGAYQMALRHVEKVAQYAGLAAPIKNYNKAMGAHIGAGGYTAGSYFLQDDRKLLNQAITELQAPRQHDSPNALTDFLDKMQDSFVKATLLNNISVTIKQAASYATAGLYVSQRALAPYQGKVAEIFLNSGSKENQALFAEIDEHTAAHYMRRKGMSLQEAAMIAKDESRVVRWMDENIKNPAANPLKWIQGMDVATTAALWLACKEQVRLDGGKQTDSDYWDKVTELYEKVIEETQPMYDVLHRPEVQRTTNSLIRQLFMFRTQPLQNAGILWDAAGNYTQAKKTGKGVQAAKEKLQRAVLSQVASAAVFAAMKLISHAIRNRMKPYKDKEEHLTLWSVTKTMLSDMASTGAGLLLPVGGEELFDIVKGGVKIATTGKTGYDVFTVPAVDQLNDWISDVDSLFKNLYDLRNDNLDIEKLGGDLKMVAFDAAAVAGIPARNVWNIVVGIIGNVTDIAGVPISWATDEENTTSGVKAAFDNGHYALGREKMEKIIQQKVDGGRTLTQARGDVRSTITGYFKPLYVSAYRKGNKKEMERIRRALQATWLYDDLAETLADWVK